MMIKIRTIALGFCMAGPATVLAQTPVADPCQEIVAACQAAGFVKGDAKAGYGVFADCFDPILGGKEPSNDSKRLPSVSPAVVASCRARRAAK